MIQWRLGVTVGILAGLVSGIMFCIMEYTAAFVFLSGSNIDIGFLVLSGIIAGILVGLCAGLAYARMRESLPGRSSMARALALASVFSLPWALTWLFIVPLINSVAPSDYMQWIHSFGIEIRWLAIRTSPQQVTDLIGFLDSGAYLMTYILIVITWTFMFGILLSFLWDRKAQFGGERRSK
jgi:hypothetical protein